MNWIEKLILKDHPGYDFSRYRFKDGDFVKLDDGAVILVKQSGLVSVSAYVYKKSFKYHEYIEYEIPYSELPYFKKGEFKSEPYRIKKSLLWKEGDVVQDPEYGTVGYLYADLGEQKFYMWVLESPNPVYVHTGVYIENYWGDYVNQKKKEI